MAGKYQKVLGARKLKDITIALGGQLQFERKRQGLTLRKVNDLGGPSVPTLRKIEQGQLTYTWRMLAKYCDALKLTAETELRKQIGPAPPLPLTVQELEALRDTLPPAQQAVIGAVLHLIARIFLNPHARR